MSLMDTTVFFWICHTEYEGKKYELHDKEGQIKTECHYFEITYDLSKKCLLRKLDILKIFV